MKLLVLGATGGTGREIVKQALDQAHDVTAFVRDPGGLAAGHERLRVVRGSVPEDAALLEGAVKGQDAVISSLGKGNGLKSGDLIARAVPAIVGAMEKQGVRRLVFISACGVGDTRRQAPLFARVLYGLLLRDLFADKKAGEDVLRRSGLDWTLVYPTMLTNGPRTSRYRAGERLELRGLPRISRADVAEFVLRQLKETAYLRKGAIISN